ncbi:natriuretic peptides A [Ornithorhynchus anatinus]|uniref:Natriuretic peptides A n=1 Tax=Ornithorhynchus anatinus TaxID=9258 RepID=F6TF44_ORNAN|nr:natriuretic peptides A [Ornithorhynchus anatinus]
MGLCTAICAGMLLLLTLQLQGQGLANPIYEAVPNSDLVDFKALLDRLEDKMPSEEAAVPSQGFNEQNDEIGAALNPLSPWSGDVSPAQRDGALGRGPWEQPERAALLKNKLRTLLTGPRSLRRFSSCFGSRIDRIGAQSGLGCNSYRSQR